MSKAFCRAIKCPFEEDMNLRIVKTEVWCAYTSGDKPLLGCLYLEGNNRIRKDRRKYFNIYGEPRTDLQILAALIKAKKE